jgi:hypothetical protein
MGHDSLSHEGKPKNEFFLMTRRAGWDVRAIFTSTKACHGMRTQISKSHFKKWEPLKQPSAPARKTFVSFHTACKRGATRWSAAVQQRTALQEVLQRNHMGLAIGVVISLFPIQ